MAQAKRLIIGLGNPGSEYEGTRHNVGFAVVDRLAPEGTAFQHDKGNTLLVWTRRRGRPFGLAKPLTYMNRSGTAVKNLIGHYGIELENVLVVVDDVNLPPGKLRLRSGGSAGGHNGVQDIIDRLGSDAFPRLRIGIGDDFSRGRQADYVLAPFSPDERPIMEEAIDRAAEAVVAFVCEGLMPAMNRYNR